MSWDTVKLSQIASSQYGFTASSTSEPIGPRFLRITDIVPSSISWDNVPFCAADDATRTKYLLRKGDIVVARTGATTGYAKLIRADVDAIFASYLVRFQITDERANPDFVGRILESHIYKAYVDGVKGGAAQPNANAVSLGNFEFKLPPLPTQQRIAGILSAYDDLIENNRRRIVLLEQAARLLYREWFVQLRFPGHETAKIVDGLPEGWERATLSDHVELVKDAVQPGAFRPDDVHIGLEHIPRRSFVLSDWEPTEGLESHKFRFAAGDIIFGKIRPYFHKVGFALRDGVASSDAFVWRVKEQKAWSLLICATSSDHFVAVASKTVKEGSKMPRADWKVLAKYKIPKPNDDLLAEFDGRVRPIAEECRKLALQNRALTRARDLLLPRLMDGRIPVEV